MKQILSAFTVLIALIIPSPAAAQGYEPPIPAKPIEGDFVLDTLNWMTPAQERLINSIAGKLDMEGIAQLAVVTWDDCGTDKQSFRKALFDGWEIGHRNDQDGLLILVCWYGGDESRRSVEQVTGSGLVKTLPDSLASQIVEENFIPAFKNDAPGGGLLAMVEAYDRILRREGKAPEKPSSLKVFLTAALLGSLPGIFFSTLYVNIRRSGNPLTTRKIKGKKRIAYKNEVLGVILPGLKMAALAEIVSLAFIVLSLFFNREGIITLPPYMQSYAEPVLSYLLYWLVTLFVFYLSPYFPEKDRETGWWNSSGDGPSSGDSEGGSSTNF